MKKVYTYIILFACTASTLSCKKFLGVEPKGKVLLTNVSDFDLFLNSSDLTVSGAWELNLLGDDVDKPSLSPEAKSEESLIYIWAPQFSVNDQNPPAFWGQHHSNIYRYNAVINGIDNAQNGNESDKKRIKAEALLGRAFEYFYLINLYAKPYNANTAGTDLGVPFITSTDIIKETPPRSTVAQIYKHIFDDIAAAIPYLPATNQANNARGAVRAAHGVLARIYYYMGRLADANTEAQLVLNSQPSAIINYNTTSAFYMPVIALRANEIYARYSSNINGQDYPTIKFYKSYDPNDLRLRDYKFSKKGITPDERGVYYFVQNSAKANFGISEEEMRLIVAENAAVNGAVDKALEQVELIRKNRIKAANYKPLVTTDKDQALAWVLRERSFELAYKGLRWFDMRRLQQEGKIATVERTGLDGTIIATLPPNSPRYVLQIPISVIYFNPNMPLNDE